MSSSLLWAVGFSGPARVGKSHAARVAEEYFRVDSPELVVETVACADVLKRMCAILLCWENHEAFDDASKPRVASHFMCSPSSIRQIVRLFCAEEFDESAFSADFGMTHGEMEQRIWRGVRAVAFCTSGQDNCQQTRHGPHGCVFRFHEVTSSAPVTYGRMLQLVGTEWMRNGVSRTVFADYIRAYVRRRHVAVLICPDIRMEEEFQMIQDLGGFVARLRSGDGVPALVDGRSTAHTSEAGLRAHAMDEIVNPFTPDFDRAIREWIGRSVATRTMKQK